MKAIEVARFGGPEVLRLCEVPDPVPGAGEVVVDVAAADTLWLETSVRAGAGGAYFPVTLPYRPGVGVAGTVSSGSGGRRVVARLGHDGGGYATRVAVAADALVDIPDGVRDRTAAALLHDGVTALALMDVVKVVAGDRVLVTAAAGGMGALLVQVARAAGATVVAAARGPAKLAALRALGPLAPDAVVDYGAADWTDTVWNLTGGVDVVLDGAGGDYGRAAFDLVVDGGRFSAHGMPAGAFAVADPDLARARGVTATGIEAVQLRPDRFRGYLTRALRDAAAGRLTPLIGQTFPLERAADAHAAIESRTAVGKTVLTVA
ncbi:zinc-binding dehydrogenase [Dactylosporangium aurantiacum]|uniref:Zinc-binding dehydrogenase n=1 Tax=Dactylosporangium aurantiacum TaxID=35754 RepID=A0A9Q9ID17_9ACTN|nr:zinc-binding dehydrogenase [Dactylosporangium aurantiacum]MDG6102725.1 zinc-binding dehydrogenase [Dactylosporangium aurantiacum]UWZ53031.1 zinc-binding dehydrogenase [Dactylosporangium aurantiacum]